MTTYRPDFWVLAGTTAPVISLSCIVLLSDHLKLVKDVADTRKLVPPKISRKLLRRVIYAYAINAFNIAFQALVLYSALRSVALDENDLPPNYVWLGEALGLGALLVATGNAASIRLEIKLIGERNSYKKNAARYMWNQGNNRRRSANRTQRSISPREPDQHR